MAYVDTEKVLETARDGYHSDFGRSMADLTSLREVLEDTPDEDVVKVVRCMDCENYKGEQYNCWLMRTKMKPLDFCSYGERKEN